MEESLPPRKFISKYHLPQLVRIHDAHLHKLNNEDNDLMSAQSYGNSLLDLDQPFLLYKAYPCRQVIAHTLDTDGMGDYKRVGPALLIPEGYPGWFSIVTTAGHTAGYFTSIDQVARAQVPCFLSRDDITGYLVPKLTGDAPVVNQTHNYSKITINGGTVCRFLGVYEDISVIVYHYKKNSVSKKHRPDLYHPRIRYAKCIRFTSFGGEIIFIPITETGRFYVVSKRTNPRMNSVFSISSLLRVAKLPITVQLIVGPKPRNYHQHNSNNNSLYNKAESNDTNFSAVLRLEEIRVRDVILACTIRPQPFAKLERSSSSLSSSVRRSLKSVRNLTSSTRNDDPPLLLEFDLDSSFLFCRTFSEKNGTITSRKIPDLVLQRIAYCNAEADLWKKQIKIAHDVIPRNSILDLNFSHTSSNTGTTTGTKKGFLSLSSKKKRGLLEDAFDDKMLTMKNASIGSRTSSNGSKSSRISRVLNHLWSPLKNNKNRINEDDCFTENDHITNDDNLSVDLDHESNISEFHYYETLRKDDYKSMIKKDIPSLTNRRDTLDVVFPKLKIDDNGYILKSQKCLNHESNHHEDNHSDSIYSTIDCKKF